jgi:hypothetical protein
MGSVVPIPRSKGELLSRLKRPKDRNEMVRDILLELIGVDDRFFKLIDATSDEEAVEGTMDDDDLCASLLIRDYASPAGRDEVDQDRPHSARQPVL